MSERYNESMPEGSKDSDTPQSKPENSQNRSLWQRLISKFRVSETFGSTPKPENIEIASGETSESPKTVDETLSEETRIEEIQRQLKELESKPKWHDREIDLGSINLREIPLNWQALTDLGKAINRLKDDPFAVRDFAALKPEPSHYIGIPMVASVIANKNNPEVPVILPTEQEVKALKPWLSLVTGLLGRIHPTLAAKFDRYFERKGAEIVVISALKIAEIGDFIGTIPNPRKQFLNELSDVYKNLQKEETYKGFLGETVYMSIEQKVSNFLNTFDYLRHYRYDPPDFPARWLNSKQFPIVIGLLPKLRIPDTNAGTTSIAGAELMEGVEIFLKRKGVRNIGPAPLPSEFDLFNLDTWGRGLAVFFKEET